MFSHPGSCYLPWPLVTTPTYPSWVLMVICSTSTYLSRDRLLPTCYSPLTVRDNLAYCRFSDIEHSYLTTRPTRMLANSYGCWIQWSVTCVISEHCACRPLLHLQCHICYLHLYFASYCHNIVSWHTPYFQSLYNTSLYSFPDRECCHNATPV